MTVVTLIYPGAEGALQYQMDRVWLTLPKAGAFGENTVSKSGGSLGEKPNFGSKLGGIRWESFSECFKSKKWGCHWNGEKWSQILVQKIRGPFGGWECFSECFKSKNLQKKIVENGKNYQFVDEIETKSSFLWQLNEKIGGLWVRAIKEPTFYSQKCGVSGWQQRQSAKIWGHWVTAALKIGGLLSLTSASPP